MDMLEVLPAHLPRCPRTSVHVVQLLLAGTESVRVTLEFRNLSNNIEVLKAGDLDKSAQRLDSSELVEVASNDDRGVLVLRQNLGDEAASDLGLADTAVYAAVDGRASIAL